MEWACYCSCARVLAWAYDGFIAAKQGVRVPVPGPSCGPCQAVSCSSPKTCVAFSDLQSSLLRPQNTAWPPLAYPACPCLPLPTQVKLFQQSSGFCFVTFSDHQAPVSAVAFLPSGHVLVSASLDGTVRAYDLVR